MLKIILLFLWLLPEGSGAQFLNKIPLFQKESYFKHKVYEEHSWKSFNELKEAKEIVNPNSYDLHLLNAAFFFATNKLREEKHLPVFKFSSGLRNAAVVHTAQMVEKNFFEHINPKTPALRMPQARIKMFGVNSLANGENIDMNSFEMPLRLSYLQVAEALVKDLYNSPPHRKVMLDPKLIYLGTAAMFETKDENHGRSIKATQDFSGNY